MTLLEAGRDQGSRHDCFGPAALLNIPDGNPGCNRLQWWLECRGATFQLLTLVIKLEPRGPVCDQICQEPPVSVCSSPKNALVRLGFLSSVVYWPQGQQGVLESLSEIGPG